MAKAMTNGERMVKIETDIEYIKSKVDVLTESFKQHITASELAEESFNRRFASKWVERFAIALMSGGGVALLVALIGSL